MGNSNNANENILRPDFQQGNEQDEKIHIIEITGKVITRQFEIDLGKEPIGYIEAESTPDKDENVYFWFRAEGYDGKEFLFGTPGDINDQNWLAGMLFVCVDDYLSDDEDYEEDE